MGRYSLALVLEMLHLRVCGFANLVLHGDGGPRRNLECGWLDLALCGKYGGKRFGVVHDVKSADARTPHEKPVPALFGWSDDADISIDRQQSLRQNVRHASGPSHAEELRAYLANAGVRLECRFHDPIELEFEGQIAEVTVALCSNRVEGIRV